MCVSACVLWLLCGVRVVCVVCVCLCLFFVCDIGGLEVCGYYVCGVCVL